MGRPSKALKWVEEDNLILVEGWARDGLSDEQIAHNIGIHVATLYDWKKKYPKFSEAIKKGKAPVDYEVENAMLKSALGFKMTLKKPIKVKTEKQKVGEGKIVEEHIEYAEEEVYIPPQTVAQMFWLKNRRPEKWRDRPVAEDNRALETLANILDETKKAIERENADIQQETEGIHTESESPV